MKKVFARLEGDSLFCQGCTKCCTWEGDVNFSEDELERLADFLGMDARECAEKYFELAEDRRHLRLRMGRGESCPFLGENGCQIYSARPEQCRNFPYVWTREEERLMKDCRLYSEIKKRNNINSKERKNEKD